jgi:SAM-dependent methyltransferase
LTNGLPHPPIQFGKVADLYDSYVRVDFDIPFWLAEAHTLAGESLELGAGTGRVSLPLLRAGVRLTCVDYSPEMLAVLRRKLQSSQLTAKIYEQDIAALDIPGRYDLIFIPFHAFSEILDQDRQKAALRRIHSHLTPSGVFICPLQNPRVRSKTLDGTLVTLGEFPLESGRSLIVRSQVLYERRSQRATGRQLYEVYDGDKKLVHSRSLEINFVLFEKEEFEELVRAEGFSVISLYGDYSREQFDCDRSPFMIWKLARRQEAGTDHQL